MMENYNKINVFDIGAETVECIGQLAHLLLLASEQVECKAQCGAATNAWQFGELPHCLFE